MNLSKHLLTAKQLKISQLFLQPRLEKEAEDFGDFLHFIAQQVKIFQQKVDLFNRMKIQNIKDLNKRIFICLF